MSEVPAMESNPAVLVDAICALLKVTGDVANKLQYIQNSMTEISVIRQELIQINEKLDKLLSLVTENPEAKSSFVKYFLS